MNAYLNLICTYFPTNSISNEDIATQFPEWTIDKISSKVGVDNRYCASENETAGDLAFYAAEKLFAEHELLRSKVDYIIFCTQSPDYVLPSTACILQDRLKISKQSGAFDFNLGCSGYVYGLGIAKGLILTNQAKCVLLLTGETYTKYINKKDKGNKTIFGDAATASIITSEVLGLGLDAQIHDFCYGTDGSKFDSLIVKNGMARHKENNSIDQIDGDGVFLKNDNDLYMDGKSIFEFTAFQIPPLINETLNVNNKELSDIDEFIFHQANAYMLDFVRKRCKIPEEKFFVDIKEIGNTVSNTLPIALDKSYSSGRFKNKRNILLAGFGVGLSMGSVIISINND